MDKTLTYNQVNQAFDLLYLDPDAYPDSVMNKVIENRNRLKPHAREWDQIVRDIVSEHSDGALPEEPDDPSPLEEQFGVQLSDPKAVMRELDEKGRETVEVTLATATREQLLAIDVSELDSEDDVDGGAEEETEDGDQSVHQKLDRWFFMLDSDVS